MSPESRVPVPGTDVLADVAAEHVGADRGAELRRNRTPQFDIKVSDAPRGVHHVRLNERSGGAGIEAPGAGTAAVKGRRVGLEIEAGEDNADKEPRAALLIDEASVLAHPADA